jgi:hypothetical protein
MKRLAVAISVLAVSATGALANPVYRQAVGPAGRRWFCRQAGVLPTIAERASPWGR